MDACLLFGYCRRDVGFLMAAKSFNRFVVGQFARWIQAIPVLRAADMARKGPPPSPSPHQARKPLGWPRCPSMPSETRNPPLLRTCLSLEAP